MRIKIIIKFLLILNACFFSFYSFSQENSNNTKSFVQIYDSLQIDDGYILLMTERMCSLIDRSGNVLFNIPGNLATFSENRKEIATHNNNNLVVYNKNLDLLWKIPAFIDHELCVTEENSTMFLTKQYYPINNIKVFFNTIICIDSTKKKSVKWSSYEQRRYLMDFLRKDTSIFLYKINDSTDPDSVLYKIAPTLITDKKPFSSSPDRKPDTSRNLPKTFTDSISQDGELFHMNSIQVIPANKSEEKDTVFRKGNILLSFSNNSDSIRSFIAIVDPENFNILWYYIQKDGRSIHTPTMLQNGHILIYVNTSSEVPYSCIEEIDPLTKKVEWRYTEGFPCNEKRKVMGSCQRLPNGNTLISNVLGYVYEVNPAQEIVWLWHTPPSIKKGDRVTYRAYWFPKEKLEWLVNE